METPLLWISLELFFLNAQVGAFLWMMYHFRVRCKDSGRCMHLSFQAVCWLFTLAMAIVDICRFDADARFYCCYIGISMIGLGLFLWSFILGKENVLGSYDHKDQCCSIAAMVAFVVGIGLCAALVSYELPVDFAVSAATLAFLFAIGVFSFMLVECNYVTNKIVHWCFFAVECVFALVCVIFGGMNAGKNAGNIGAVGNSVFIGVSFVFTAVVAVCIAFLQQWCIVMHKGLPNNIIMVNNPAAQMIELERIEGIEEPARRSKKAVQPVEKSNGVGKIVFLVGVIAISVAMILNVVGVGASFVIGGVNLHNYNLSAVRSYYHEESSQSCEHGPTSTECWSIPSILK